MLANIILLCKELISCCDENGDLHPADLNIAVDNSLLVMSKAAFRIRFISVYHIIRRCNF